MENRKIIAPKPGWQTEIAKMVGCSRETVRQAIHYGARGVKAEKARQIYRAKYLSN